MECLLCGKHYISLGIHLRRKHHIDPADYREEFGMMKTTPLCDANLSEQISNAAKHRLLDPDWRAETVARCKENCAKRIGRPPAECSQAAKDKLAERNRKNHTDRLDKLAPVVAEILREKKTLRDVYRDIGMSANAVKKIVKSGKANYSKEIALIVGAERRELAKRGKRK